MTCGHLILGYDAQDMFYIALAFIICGFGYFESNIACLVNQIYPEDHPKRDSGFVILYIGGNIGGPIGAMLCGYLSHFVSWDFGFSIAGIGMLFGIVIFLSGSKHIPNINPLKYSIAIYRMISAVFIAILSFVVLVGIVECIKHDYETYIVSLVTLI